MPFGSSVEYAVECGFDLGKLVVSYRTCGSGNRAEEVGIIGVECGVVRCWDCIRKV